MEQEGHCDPRRVADGEVLPRGDRQNADRGHVSITHQTGKEFWVTQGYDTMPGHPGGEFNVDFYVEGSGFKYLGGAPYDGTIKHVIVRIDDQQGYDISKLHIAISPQFLQRPLLRRSLCQAPEISRARRQVLRLSLR